MKDTIIVKNKGQLYVSTSFKQLTNHHNDNGFNLNLSTKLNLSRTKTGNSSRSKQELNSELSFTKYIDSIIVVYDDEIEYTGNWEYQSLSILNTINLKIKSQFTNSYNYKYQSNGFNKVLSKKLFSPTQFSLGTGFNFKFDTFNYINFSVVDINTTFISENLLEENSESQRLSGKLFYLPMIGMSINTSIYKTWSKESFTWRNNSKFFIKGFRKDDFQFNFKNRFMYEIYKWINVSLENQLLYDPLYNYKIQLKNELVVGMVFR